ncbi:prepilin-type N-terminal cleavage/methylation domain-containing protein [Pseudoalteromonas carrageenovora]|uniref:prepilin-type N-terminal cleavage/methylation domain-containing protein n=1 Tax=Pseudoalteromonas carrageenovora TaxID=227 RepID=UPI0026E21654|nr:prepilin-type N-terminal cleavage/methylation domain-containing protein [Pseudoalteromonas carrageenovora]MDO6463721.1 prepilin-type N-terminal cleavage/methylation domain-containing protein [Pseudoalteromonas carrageenovora]
MIASRVYSKGFTLFELVIVVILLAIIMSFAIPQYLGIKNQAYNSSVDAVAGGFASAVGMVKGQWELEGRPSGKLNTTFVNYGGVIVGVDGTKGTPTSDETTKIDTRALASNAQKCRQVLRVILQDAPSSTLSNEVSIIKSVSFLVRYNAKNTQCIYYLTNTLDTKNIPTNGAVVPGLAGFSYFPQTGKVKVFKLSN